jgi:hypothetical protein
MITQIQIGGCTVPFRLDWQHARWHSLEEIDEGDFPLVTLVGAKRYELYSDGTFAEVER